MGENSRIADVRSLLIQKYKSSTRNRIVSQLSAMRGTALRLATLLTESSTAVAKMSIAQVAEQCDTSPSTLLRLSREVGYRNFSTLKKVLAAGDSEDNDADFLPETAEPALIDSASRCMAAMLDTFYGVDMSSIREAARLLLAAKYITVFGAALSSSVAGAVEFGLRYQALPTHLTCDTEMVIRSLPTPDQLFFCVSHLGASPAVIRVLTHYHKYGVPIILLTNLASAQGCKYADLVLTTNITSLPNTGEDVFSRVSGMFMTELLVSEISKLRAESKCEQQA